MRHIILVLALMLAATTASAQAGLTLCDGNKERTTLSNEVGVSTVLCCEAAPTETGSCEVNITAAQASVCLNRDTGSSGGAAVIAVKWCTPGETTGANTCTTIESISTDTCRAYSRGLYQLEYTTGPGAGQNAKASVRGY